MIGPVGGTRIDRVGLNRTTGTSGTKAGNAMSSLAGRVAGRVAHALDLLDDERPRRPLIEGEDLYEVAATARDLNGQLNGRPSDEGQFVRSLGAFVTESASLIAARPSSHSLDAIEGAIRDQAAGAPPMETAATALLAIEATTRRVAGLPFAMRP